ncbi:MAG: 1-acyl-sn-glycerol-3-phosphate acyltransferase [Pseudomonadota bacterium]
MDPIDTLLRARLRIPEGADLQITALRWFMEAVDAASRLTTRQAFFALRESREMLVAIEGQVGMGLIQSLLAMKGGTQVRAVGLENVPATGGVIIGSTHPIGTFDFIAHAAALWAHRPDLKVVAGRESERFLGSDLLIPVDLDRKDKVLTARQTLKGMRDHVRSGGALVVFGSGRVPRRERGLLVEPPWRSGITRISEQTGVPIVPASTHMRNSDHYYRTRRLAALVSGGNDEVGRRVASLRYASELFAKLGGSYDVHYGPAQPAGTAPQVLQELSETLVPGLYRP